MTPLTQTPHPELRSTAHLACPSGRQLCPRTGSAAPRKLIAGPGRTCVRHTLSPRQCSSTQAVLRTTEQQSSNIVPLAPNLAAQHKAEQDSSTPVYVSLASDFLTAGNSLAHPEALRAGLKALRSLGVHGVAVDVYWGLVEAEGPMVYDWSTYHALFKLVRECGLKAQVQLCFHGQGSHGLPPWVLDEGRSNPDIFYTDRHGHRNMNYLTLGVDHVTALRGRTALAAYADLMRVFAEEFAPLLGSTVNDVVIGLGPDGELKYPAHCPAAGWSFPGTGEFQCYDQYMLASLRACAQHVGTPAWGAVAGPHDAGTYSQWPHESCFFQHDGSWSSDYGTFFLQWYSSMLLRHADEVLAAAASAISSPNVRLGARLPLIHWWYNQTSHAAELAAGYFNTMQRDGYLPAMKVLQRHGATAHLASAELRTSEQPDYALADPEKLLLQQRTSAAALQLRVTLSNQMLRFDEAALGQLDHQLFSPFANRGVDLPNVNGLVFGRLCDQMFEPANWQALKRFVRRHRERSEALDAVAASQKAARDAAADASGAPLHPMLQQQQQRHTAAVLA